MVALLEEPGGGAPLLGIQKDMWRRAQGTSISLHGGPTGQPGWGLVYPGTYALKKGLEMGISLHRGPDENVGGPFTSNSER